MTTPISRYLNVRQAYHPEFCSDGRSMVFLSNITGAPQVWQVRLPEAGQEPAWPTQLTFEADRVLGVWCSPRAKDPHMIFTRDEGGNENAQLFLLNPHSGRETLLSAGFESAMHMFGSWSSDGERILFSANRRDPGIFDLYLQTLGNDAQLIWRNEQPGYLTNLTFSPDEGRCLVVRRASSFAHDLFEIDLLKGTARQLNPPEKIARFDAVGYTPDGACANLNTDLDDDFLYIARLNLEQRNFLKTLSPHWDIETLTHSRDGKRLAFTVNTDGASDLHLLDLDNNSSRLAPLPEGPGVVGFWDEHMAFSPNAHHLAFSYTSATRTSDIYVWNVDEKVIRPVTRASHGGLPRSSFIPPQLIRYPTFDNRRIPAWFYIPPQAKSSPVPAVVMVHGGPESQFKPFFHFMVQYLLQNGYAVLAPNVRGSTGYGKHYSHLDDVEKRMHSVEDLAHAALWLKRQAEIDGDRLAVYGGSYGGFMVLSTLTTHPDLWAAGVDIVGISNMVTFLENTSDYRRAHREAEYGSLSKDRTFLERISPMTHIANLRAPLMVIHGANDPRVPLSEAEQLVETLRERNVPVEFLVFDDEGHGLVRLQNKRVAYPSILHFLDEHLGN